MTSEHSFNTLIGQAVTCLEAAKNGNIHLSIQNGGLNVECPWRIINANGEVAAGSSDFLWDDNRLHADRARHLLEGRVITEICISLPADLTVRFRDGIRLDLFHNSCVFEGWQLSGDDGSLSVSLPGGTYTEFS